MKKKPDPSQMDAMMQSAAGQLGMTPDALRSAMQSGSPGSLLNRMSPEDAKKLHQALSDKNTAARVLASPEAQAIMQKLFGGK